MRREADETKERNYPAKKQKHGEAKNENARRTQVKLQEAATQRPQMRLLPLHQPRDIWPRCKRRHFAQCFGLVHHRVLLSVSFRWSMSLVSLHFLLRWQKVDCGDSTVNHIKFLMPPESRSCCSLKETFCRHSHLLGLHSISTHSPAGVAASWSCSGLVWALSSSIAVEASLMRHIRVY